MIFETASRSDRGLRRRKNEDALLVREDLGLLAVADGMGGHPAGDVASRLAVDALEAELRDAGSRPADARTAADSLDSAVRAANRAILARGAETPAMRGMGTTLTALVAMPAERVVVIAHVGDSRAYRVRRGRTRQITTDHTWVQRQVERRALSAADARTHPYGNVLERVLGMEGELEVDLWTGELEPDDLWLLCTDGLTGLLEDAEIRQILRGTATLDAKAGALVAAANERGGTDNISVVLGRAVG